MTPELLKRIETAVEACQDQGVELVYGSWGIEYDFEHHMWEFKEDNDTSCACLLGCLLLHEQPKIPQEYIDAGMSASNGINEIVAACLQLLSDDVEAIVDGFDKADTGFKWDPDAVKLRDEYKPSYYGDED